MINTHYPISALVVGLAREGTSLARYLAARGARVTVTDTKPADALADSLAALADLQVNRVLGGHPLALLDGTDIVFVSPGVPLEIPLLVEARRRGLPLSSETRLFTHLCPAPIVGITGSSGKTTTTALAGEMLRAAGHRIWVGGNIGRPLTDHLDEIDASDTVVMELSSFQLAFFAPWSGEPRHGALFDPEGWSPPVAALLNITPNHLDRHGTMEAYIAAKAHILNHQHSGDIVVLNQDNQITRKMGEDVERDRRVLWFSLEQEVTQGAFLHDDQLILRLASHQDVICRTTDLQLLGRHNVANMLAACALGGARDVPISAIRQTATSFSGVEHRLERVRELRGACWYNDSIATTPERTVAALSAFREPVVLLAGGRDKHLPWDEMAALTWRKVRHLILFGEAAGLIADTMQATHGAVRGTDNTQPATHIHHAGTLEQAVEVAEQVAQPGDVVLLSPGGTSFDAYPDYVARGEHFRRLVQALE
jgi:UDP-N-acetylmuramoylalanine--D-glutamate ligase